MTIVCWDGRTLAADKQSSDAGLIRIVTKIRRGRGGALIGCAGDHATALALFSWWEAGAAPADFPDKDHKADLLVIQPNCLVTVYEGGCGPCLFEDQQYAFGHGRDFATAAMALGKSAREAVELTCRFDIYCGGGVDTLTFEPCPPVFAEPIEKRA